MSYVTQTFYLFGRKRKPHWLCDICVNRTPFKLTSLGRPHNRSMTTQHRCLWVLLNLKLSCHSCHHTSVALAPGHHKDCDEIIPLETYQYEYHCLLHLILLRGRFSCQSCWLMILKPEFQACPYFKDCYFISYIRLCENFYIATILVKRVISKHKEKVWMINL